MKKRVYRSEIEFAKEATRAIVFLLVIVFVIATVMLIISGTLANIISFPVKSTNKENLCERACNLDTNNANINKYFNYVKITGKNVFDDLEYSNKEKVIASKLEYRSKYRIASNIYLKDINSHVSDDDVKEAFEIIFGKDSYIKQNILPVLETERSNTNKSAEVVIPYEKITSAKRKKNKLDIYSAVLYFNSSNKSICIDRLCTNIITTLKNDYSYGDEYFNLYILYHAEELSNYTYHFEMDESGFYYYLGYDKTN